MTIYRVNLRSFGYTSHGYIFTRTITQARKALREAVQNTSSNSGVDEQITSEQSSIEPLSVGRSKTDLVRFLNRYAGHNDNG